MLGVDFINIELKRLLLLVFKKFDFEKLSKLDLSNSNESFNNIFCLKVLKDKYYSDGGSLVYCLLVVVC